MYDELVKELRDSAEWADRLALLMGRAEGDAHAPIMREAADAIEELSKHVTDWIPPHDALAIIEEYGIPYWIPSEDCLPTIGEEIITLGPNGGMDCGHYKGLSDTRRDKWNWKQHTVKTVKYWLPRKSLPQPPKEE